MREELIHRLQALAPGRFRCYIECGDGWYPILAELARAVASEPNRDLHVIQVKEKYGGLRFYTSHTSESLDPVITFAEALSYRYCEVCGAPASATRVKQDPRTGEPTGFWYATLCREHHAKRDAGEAYRGAEPSFSDEEDRVSWLPAEAADTNDG